ncbi:hypothetical protein SCALM49S_02049 [Streptomyces californicus]
MHVLAVAADGTALGTGRLLHGAAAAGKTGGAPGVGSLGRLAVGREARGLGVGAALVRAIEDEARALGLTAFGLAHEVLSARSEPGSDPEVVDRVLQYLDYRSLR